MSKWEMVSIGSINKYESKSINPMRDPDKTFELYSVPNYDYDYPEIVTGAEIGSTKQIVQEGDVLLCKINPRINRVWSVGKYTKYPQIASSEWIVIRNNDILSKYLIWCLKSNPFRSLLTTNVTGIGGSLTRVQPKLVKEYLIPLPPLDIQKHIADTLDKTQEIIDCHKKQLEELDNLIKATFYDMFGDLILNDKDWQISSVDQVCKYIYGGGTPSKGKPEYYIGDIPWVTPKDMKANFVTDSIDHINEDAINNSSVKLIPKNSILMVIRSGILKKVLPVAINKVDVTVNQDMKGFVVENMVKPEYLLYYFIMTQSNILKNVRSVTADNIEFGLIKNASLPIPPLDLQTKFAEIVTNIEQQKTIVKQSLTESQNLFNSLMSKYFD